MGHEWNTIIVKGENYPIQLGDKDRLGYHIKGFTYRPPKIYRTTFGNHKALIEDETDVPPLFKDKRVIDVTHEYLPTTVIELPESFKEYGNYRYAYLSVFDLMNWKPVAFGTRKGKTVQFKNMGLEAVYLPVFYKKGAYYPAYHPVKVDKEGNCIFLKPNKEKLRKVRLRRKFMDKSPKQWADAMVGGCFVFSKEALFANADTLRVDSLYEYAYQTVEINGTYRYMKYVPPAYTKGNIAEIELYDKQGIKVQGEVTGNYNPGWLDSMVTMCRAFDGDVLTFTSAGPEQGDAWLGLDFERQVEVNKLVYLPRSDDNFIKEGELYELFYWDKEWKSLGQQSGSRQLQYLEYDNVPDNALLLLRNLTKGKEERIFTYENGKQIWW